jgi:hypothetical protein
MSTPRNPDVWVEFTLTKAPTSLGEDTYLWAVRPCADDSTYFDGFKEARITVFGSIERALSDPVFGTYSVAQWRFTANDTDGTIRSLLNDYEPGRDDPFDHRDRPKDRRHASLARARTDTERHADSRSAGGVPV